MEQVEADRRSGISNRSEAIRGLIREYMVVEEWRSEEGYAIGTITHKWRGGSTKGVKHCKLVITTTGEKPVKTTAGTMDPRFEIPRGTLPHRMGRIFDHML